MKKLISTLFLAFVALVTYAQNNPERLLVVEKNGSFKGFLVERIDSMFFDRIDEPVNVSVEIHEFNNDDPKNQTMTVSFKRSKECMSFQFAILPKSQSDAWADDGSIAGYFNQLGLERYQDDFDHAQMSGFGPLTPGGEYTLVGLAYDHFGIACEATRVNFKVPDVETEGKPSVTWNLDDVQTNQITLTMTPNDDCNAFFICLFEEGAAQAEFEQWAPMFGFATIGDMVRAFSGEAHYSEYTHTWKDLAPGTNYEIYIVPTDINDIAGEDVIAKVTTKQMGGDGLAEMTITVGEFGYEKDQDGVAHYYQQIIYTPNDQTAAHRDMMLKKSAIDEGLWTEESFVEYMKNDKNPDFPEDQYWDNYGVDDVKWNAEPNTTYYVYSIGKNAKGEWGTLAKEIVTTGAPATLKAKQFMNHSIAQRMNMKSIKNFNGRTMIKNKVRLTK